MSTRNPKALPADTLVVRTYTQLGLYLQRFVEGQLGLLLLLGRPGTGKTHHARTAINRCAEVNGAKPALYVEGHLKAYGLYRKLWEFRDRPVVLDDLDRLYADPDCVRILKPLCSGNYRNAISWITNATRTGTDVPDQFTTSSHVALIANEWHSLNSNVRALEDRAIIVRFDPPNDEVHRQAHVWFDDDEVYRFIARWVDHVPTLSLRHYEKGRRLHQAGFADWQESLKRMMRPDARVVIVSQILADVALVTEESRVARFCQRTGCSRATYFRLKSRIAVL